MKQLLLFPFLSIGFLQLNNQLDFVETNNGYANKMCGNKINDEIINLGVQDGGGSGRMAAAVFKSQEFCRVELKDFEFDAQFNLSSVTVYFTGANFKIPEKAILTNTSLKPIKSQMERCTPGSVVIFDEVKVDGPDKLLRTIPGMSVLLY